MEKEKYPECEKLRAVSDKSQVVGEFLDWLSCDKGVILGEYKGERLGEFYYNTENLLAEFFKIDLKKIEEERREILKSLN